MKISILISAIFAFFISLGTQAQVNSNYTFVEGYYRSNGTYVQGHHRTLPNSTINDNYSTFPNVNPWTGEQGTIQQENNYQINYQYNTPTYEYPEPSYPELNYSYPTYGNTTYSNSYYDYEW